MTPEFFLRVLLVVYLGISLIMAFAYLARRRLTPGEWIFWGLVAVTIPVFGPFFVIAARPGPRLPPRHPNRRRNPGLQK